MSRRVQTYPIILSVLLLCCTINKSYARHLYVNVNNPTPGTGLTWATAFNDLNTALAATFFFDTVWVQQGTYKPTTTTDRTATFKVSGGIWVLGGFIGTETQATQRNTDPTLTILSGDIGVPGNASDNSYNVVTFMNFFGGVYLDAFTIRDGNANAGYPGSTALQPYNQGGGVLVYAYTDATTTANYATDGMLQNCIVTNNFAVYGGGVCGYGTGSGAEVQVDLLNCTITNNTAVEGAAFESLGENDDLIYNRFQNCIFSNNLTTGGSTASIIAAHTDNVSGFKQFEILNSVFYNNPLPLTYNEETGPTCAILYQNCIIWSSSAPYTSLGDIGPNISYDHCDINMTTPPSGNYSFDPQFVNAAAGNFQVVPCSPVIDEGYGNTFTFSWSTDYAGNARIQGSAPDIGIYENQLPLAPTTSNLTYCEGASAVPLTATASTGYSLVWYTVATGGTGSATAPTPSTASVGSNNYYVSQQAGACESPRASIAVTINSAAATPSAPPVTYCEGASATALTATGSNLQWYANATGGSGSTTAPTPSTAATGSATYYVTQTPAGSCESLREPVIVTINGPAALPGAIPVTYCQGASAIALTATGDNLQWYANATGGSGSTTAPTPSTAAIGSTDYYVTQTPAGSCESLREDITVTVKSASAEPIPTDPTQTYCQYANATALTATGDNLQWYTDATGGASTTTAPTPSTTSSGISTYYVTQTPASSCESARTPITVTVNPNPQPDFTFANTCIEKETSITAAASTTTPDSYNWNFASASSVSGNAQGPYNVTWNTPGNYTITLSTATGNCHNQNQHTITVNGFPQVAINPITEHLCVGNSVMLQATGASTYQWSPATGLSNTGVDDPTVQLEQSILYTVTGTDDNGCSATAQIQLQINPDCLGYYIPTGFSPNGDGKNDVFHVRTGDAPKSFDMIVFNRFGQKIFESTNVGNGWDGSAGGSPAPTGAYVYIVTATTSLGTSVKQQGTLMLVR